MKRFFKPVFQILLAGVLLVMVVTYTAPHRFPSSSNDNLVQMAKSLRDSCDPIQLQSWASNVVYIREHSPNENIVLPDFVRKIPAPCAPWRLRPSQPDVTNSPTIVGLISMGGFGSYELLIGPMWYIDTYELSEAVADGIYIRRYP